MTIEKFHLLLTGQISSNASLNDSVDLYFKLVDHSTSITAKNAFVEFIRKLYFESLTGCYVFFAALQCVTSLVCFSKGKQLSMM